MKNNKIAFYINTLERGGAERVMSILANEFSEKGYEVWLINSFKCENEYKITTKVKRIYLDNNDYKSVIKKNFSRIKKLRLILKQNQIDYLVSFLSEANFRSIIACIFLKTKIVVSIRSDPKIEYSGIKGLISKILFRFADGIVFQTNDAKAFFKGKINKRSTIIKNPVNNSFFLDANIIRNTNRSGIISVGRLEHVKNQKMLIDAYASISSECKEDLFIYGEGSKRIELERQIVQLGMSDRVHLMGSTNNVVEKVLSSKVFVLSSRVEGMPNSLLEALTLGVPLISTDCPIGGPREIIKNGINGYLVPVDDTREMALKIKKLLKDDNLQHIMLENNLVAREQYSVNYILKEWERYLLEINKH